MAIYRIVRTVVSEAYIEAESLDDAWDYFDSHDVEFNIVDEQDEIR